MRLIDADVLIEAIRQTRTRHADTAREYSLLCRCVRIIDRQPTIEAVPVDEFVEKLCEKLMENSDTIESEGVAVDVLTLDFAVETVMEIAEKMKGGAE